MIKPDERIYRHLLDSYQLEPKECLFFDDRPENVGAAKRLGIQAEQVTSREMLNERLEQLLFGI